MASAAFDELFTRSAPIAHAEPVRAARWYASAEAWVTLMLIVLVQLPVIGSLQSSNWVSEMPPLSAAALAGIAGGWLLAQSSWRAALANALGALLVVVVVLGLVLQRMTITEPLLGTGPRARWSEFWLRMHAWWNALLDANISADPLPFVVLLVALVF